MTREEFLQRNAVEQRAEIHDIVSEIRTLVQSPPHPPDPPGQGGIWQNVVSDGFMVRLTFQCNTATHAMYAAAEMFDAIAREP